MLMRGDQVFRCPRCDDSQNGLLVEDFVNPDCKDSEGNVHRHRAEKYYCRSCEERFYVLPTTEDDVFEVVEN